MQVPESKQLARAVRRHGIGLVGQYAQRMVKAQVLRASPLVVEVANSDVQIESDHLLLGSWPRYFDRRYGIQVGDTVLLTRLDDGEWFVADVISNEDFDLGDRPVEQTNVNFNTGSGFALVQVPYYNKAGVKLGVLLVYDETTLRNFSGHTTSAGSGAGVVADP